MDSMGEIEKKEKLREKKREVGVVSGNEVFVQCNGLGYKKS